MKILLFGKQRAGKDTVADYLVERYGFKKIPLARMVYWIAKHLFDMQGKNRELLINIGHKMREIDPEVFAKWVLRQSKSYSRVVVPDVRLPEEYLLLTNAGFIPIKVEADLQVRAIRPGYDPEFEDHYTETYVDKFDYDYLIENNVNDDYFISLFSQVDNIVKTLREEG